MLLGNTNITAITFDSRQVTPGALFVAIPGNRDDGAKYIQDALTKGAAVIVSSLSPLEAAAKFPASKAEFIYDANPRLALAKAAALFYNNPSKRLALFGITGTNGKTTTAGLLRDILSSNASPCGLLSTVEYSWPGNVIEASRTTPDPVTIQSSIDAMTKADCTSAVMEVSSHALDQDRTAALHFAAAAFTNLSQDHFDYHNGFEDYFACKRRLFEQLAKTNPGAPAVINIDDPYGERLYKEAEHLKLRRISYAIDKEADIRATDIDLRPDQTSFTLTAFGESIRVTTGLIGRYNISNTLCAAALALTTPLSPCTAPITPQAVAASLSQTKPRWGRLEKITAPSGAQIFIDYAHSPDAIEKALTALREVTKGKLTILFGCGGDRDRAKRPMMAEVAARLADYVILTSDNPRTEDPEKILDDVEAGIKGTSTPYTRITDRRAAIHEAVTSAAASDIILIAGKGHENYQEINGKHYHFDDREIVAEYGGFAALSKS